MFVLIETPRFASGSVTAVGETNQPTTEIKKEPK
jgi:hypothetical protein